jgi:glycolate oxidase subunit GlcD
VTAVATIARELAAIVGEEAVLAEPPIHYLEDSTSTRGVRGWADAVVLPGSTDEVARVLQWCYEHDVPVVARGGGTGYSGGAVPFGGVVCSLERLKAVRELQPLLWRVGVEAGVTTWDLRRLARSNGLMFAPDPGAGEQSQIGGNIATNAGGPHAFKYGVVGQWVSGLEVVIPPGEVLPLGGALRKDVAGYDLKSLVVGSEGTLGIVTAATLRLLPAPERVLPVAAFYPDVARGCEAIETVIGAGLQVAALEYMEGLALGITGGTFPVPIPEGAGFLVVAEADGAADEAERVREELLEVLGDGAMVVHAPREASEIEAVWRWREGVSFAVTALLGQKISTDMGVPVERLAESIAESIELASRHDVLACSWGHAGDGNIHTSYMYSPETADGYTKAVAAVDEFSEHVLAVGGTLAAEHGVGSMKLAHLAEQFTPRRLELQAEVKRIFDPKGLLNPGKKLPAAN